MGDTQTNGNVTLSYTVGQPISGLVGESNKLSQGFQQNTPIDSLSAMLVHALLSCAVLSDHLEVFGKLSIQVQYSRVC